MFTRRSYQLSLVFAAIISGFLFACAPNASVDLGNLAQTISSFPRINQVAFIGTSKVASQVLLFEVDFDDVDGDLDGGELVVSLVGKEENKTILKMKPIFLMNEIAPNAKEGRFRFPVQIGFSGESGETITQAKFQVWLQLHDALGHTSNVAKIRLLAHLN